jgi:hypothetical protein
LATASLGLFCSCVTKPLDRSRLPPEVTINRDAGRGGLLFVTLRLKSGEDLPFILDTGSPGTLFDKSLVSKLGRRLPLGTWTVSTPGGKQKSSIYWRPKLYLGSTRLKTGSLVATFDFKQLSTQVGHPIMGILAMDCLKHYCVQLDFQDGKLRFLDRHHVDEAKLGKPFLLKLSLFRQLGIHHASLAGGKSAKLLIDTGWSSDGEVERGAILGHDSGRVHLPQCVWEGETYTNVIVENGGNVIGLRFLARHLVTFDFPKRTMFLKQTSAGPLPGDQEAEKQVTAASMSESAFKFLKDLKEANQLPGWSRTDKGTANHFEVSLDSVTLDGRKEGDLSIYYFKVIRTDKDSAWKLQKAWRTDENGSVLEKYAVPEP